MTFIPATLRKSGYAYSSGPVRGLCSLPQRDQHALATFMSDHPPRVLVEFLLEVVDAGLTVEQAARRAEIWRSILCRQSLEASGGNRFPPRPLRAVSQR